MGKKRKAAQQPSGPAGPREYDRRDGKLKVNSYKDIADEQELYFLDKDHIPLEDEPRSKRARRDVEDEILDSADEDDFALRDDTDDEEEDDDEDDEEDSRGKGAAKKGGRDGLDEEQEEEGEGEGDEGFWGTSRKDYYDADAIADEQDALDEEAEALRLQRKKLEKMSAEDFVFDQDDWLASAGAADKEGFGTEGTVTEAIKDTEITEDMGAEERYQLLQTRYPEFAYLVDEFQTLQPLLVACREEAEGRPSRSLEVVRYWVLGGYVASLASYFAILTSPSRDGGSGAQKLLSPSEIRDHEIMETLVSCRDLWLRVKDLKAIVDAAADADASPEEAPLEIPVSAREAAVKKPQTNGNVASAAKKEKKKSGESKVKSKEMERSLADLSNLLTKARKSSKVPKSTLRQAGEAGDDYSDFGEDDGADSRGNGDKATRKKTLRFYTSQIDQKAKRRVGAGADAGGDMDIPHRERLRDRQARLNAEAERRGKNQGPGAELGGESSGDEEPAGSAPKAAGDEDYYDMVTAVARKKREEKAARQAALAAGAKPGLVTAAQLGEGERRKTSWAIENNKGLGPKRRKKEAKNPRVKKRMKYQEKLKKVASQKAVWKGGEERGGYQGERTGVKTGLVKSIKL